jgi:hypothetical protein
MVFPLERAYRILFYIHLTSPELNSSYSLKFLIEDIERTNSHIKAPRKGTEKTLNISQVFPFFHIFYL